MNTSSLHKARKKNHAGRPDSVSPESLSHSPVALIRSSAIGLGCTVGFGLLFLFIAALVAHMSSDPHALALPLACVALYATALFAGIITVRIHGHSALICGLIAGGLLLLVGYFVGICLPSQETTIGIRSLLPRLPVPLLSVTGAYLARKRDQPRHRRRRG